MDNFGSGHHECNSGHRYPWFPPVSESHVRDLIADHPELIRGYPLIVGREVEIHPKGRLDLLAIDKSAQLHIIEVKATPTTQRAIPQLLSYAHGARSLTSRDLEEIHNRLSRGPSLADSFMQRFGIPLPPTLHPDPALVIVAPAVDGHTAQAMKELLEHRVDIRLDTLDTEPELLAKLGAQGTARSGAACRGSHWRLVPRGKHSPELIDFCDAYLPRFTWDFAPSDLLRALYEVWRAEQLANGHYYPAVDLNGGRFWKQLAEAVAAHGGWRKTEIAYSGARYCAGDEPLASQIGWRLPAPLRFRRGYLRTAPRVAK